MSLLKGYKPNVLDQHLWFTGASCSLMHDLLVTKDDYVPVFEQLISVIRNESRAFDHLFTEEAVYIGKSAGNVWFKSHRFNGLESLQWPLQVSVTRKGNHIYHVRSRWSLNAPEITGIVGLDSRSITENISLLFPADLSLVVVLHINHQYGKIGVTVVAETSEKNNKFIPIIDWKTDDKILQTTIDYGLRDGLVRVERLAFAIKTRIASLLK